MAAIQSINKSSLLYELRIDPEFYHPNFTNLCASLEKIGSKKISFFEPIIERGKLPIYNLDGKINVIKSAKIQSGFIDESNEFVDNTFISKYPQAEVFFGDILVNSTGRGTLGRSSILTKRDNKFIIDGHVSKISKLKGLSNFYLAIYLLTKYGYKQLETFARGSSGQIEIYPEDIGSVLIPVLPGQFQEKIDKLCKNFYRSFENTKNYYFEAENMLLNRIGWNKTNYKHVQNYQINLKGVLTNERFDPEFYQPKFENLIKHLHTLNSRKLGNFCPMPNRGVQPEYNDNGKILIINSKHLGITEIDIQSAEKTTRNFFNENSTEKARLNKFDVLMYSTGAYIGRTNTYLEDSKAIGNNHVTIIRPNPLICNPIYLALFLNSPAGLMQTDQRASGSAQREIYPQDIMKYEVFIPEKNGKPDLEWQEKLAVKIIEAHEAKKQARQKLQQAKELVEKEIERLIN